jgi:hypothetical protein
LPYCLLNLKFRTRVVQKVIETMKNLNEISMVVSALSPGAITLMMDSNGSHVAHRCLQKLSSEYKAVRHLLCYPMLLA